MCVYYRMRKKVHFEDINDYLHNIKVFDDKHVKKNESIKNQLFRNKIEFDTLASLIHDCFQVILQENIQYSFSKKTILNKEILQILESKIELLKKYYIKCKHKVYLANLNEKKVITLLRQLLKVHDYELKAKEKYENGKKFLLYTIFKKIELILYLSHKNNKIEG